MKKALRLIPGFILLLSFLPFLAVGQTLIPNTTPVTENFDGIGSSNTASLPAHWKMSAAGAGSSAVWSLPANLSSATEAASSGTPSAGGRYNWGSSSSERAIGFMTSGSYSSPNAILAHYRNTTGAAITSLAVSYQIEQYVQNTSAATVDFFYSTDGSNWFPLPTGQVAFSTAGSSYTFGTPATQARSVYINSLNIANNGDIYLRWLFTTQTTNSQGLGLDGVSVTANAATPALAADLGDVVLDTNSDTKANPGETITYRDTLSNTGSGQAEGVTLSNPAPTGTTYTTGSLKSSALARDDYFTTSPGTPITSAASLNVLTNDYGLPGITVVSYGTVASGGTTTTAGSVGATTAGGQITISEAGLITSYTPPADFTGVDQFMYVARAAADLPTSEATVSITLPDIFFTVATVDPACTDQTNGSLTISASGGIGTLTYSKDGAGGIFQASNVFSGLGAGTYTLAVKDASGHIKTGSATLTNPLLITVSGTTPLSLVYNQAMSPVTYTKTNGTGSPATPWSATGLPAGVSINAASGELSGTPTATGSYNATITYTDANGCTGTLNIVVNVAPNLSNDTYAAVGNTQLVADGQSTPATPFTTSATNIRGNDASDAAIAITAVTNVATSGGGSITMDNTGKFIYTPPLNAFVPGTDSYTYTGTSNGVSATATITFNLSDMVWYVKAGGAAGDGRSNTPLNALPGGTLGSSGHYIYVQKETSGTTGGGLSLQASQRLLGAGATLTVGALTITGVADNTPTLAGGLTLANSVVVNGIDMNTGSNSPLTASGATSVDVTIRSMSSSGAANALTLTNTTGTVSIGGGTQSSTTGATFNISGGSVGVTYGGGVSQAANAAVVNVAGGHTGTLTFNTGTLSATNGTGLQFTNADGTYNFNGTTTLNGGDAGIDILSGSAGTFSFGTGTAITSPSGTAFSMSSSNASGTYSGSISDNTGYAVDIDNHDSNTFTFQTGNIASTGTGLRVRNSNGGVINFNNPLKTLTTGTSVAVDLNTSNVGGTINFGSGGLQITTTSGAGFSATGGGTVNITTGTNTNTISSGTGTALNISNTTIGASGLTFRSISANGATNGIVLNNTGNGSFSVIGDGSSDAANTTRGRTTAKSGGGTLVLGSGGTLSSTTGAAISLENTGGVILRNILIQNGGSNGITATSVTGLNIDNVQVTGKAFGYGLRASSSSAISIIHSEFTSNASDAATVPAADIRNVAFDNVTGTHTVTTSLFQNAAEHVFVLKNTSGTTTFNLTNCTFSGAQAGDGLQVLAYGSSNITANIQNITSSGNSAFGFDSGTETTQSSTLNLTVNASTFSNNFVGLSVAHGSSGTNTFSITNNNFQTNVASSSQALNINRLGGASFTNFGLFSGTISGNTIGTTGVENSGSAVGDGITVKTNGNGGITRLAILNNTIRRFGQHGIAVSARDATNGHTLEARIQGNNIAEGRASSLDGINVGMGALNTDILTMCLNITGNVVTNAVRTGIRVRSSGLPAAVITLTMPSYDGTGATYFAANNPAATGAVSNSNFSNASGTTSAGNCNTP
ncbi:Ig domain-containing protein [Telluribacter sp.]|uniref:beta strand repeat-containing protein n=1 Tax=Telluribacter sp. TaxID=1978767 RepID=UPI002E11B3E5|nr:Ig domain-containing protein [Telluribacter sp.]